MEALAGDAVDSAAPAGWQCSGWARSPGLRPACRAFQAPSQVSELSILSLLVPRTVCSQQAAGQRLSLVAVTLSGAWWWQEPELELECTAREPGDPDS